MPGLFSRLKNWVANEKLTKTDLNAEFNNILTNFQADKLKGHSDNVTQMRLQSDPGSVGTEDTGTSVSTSDEIERLRFAIARMTGETYWYTAPSTSLSEIASAISGGVVLPPSRIVSGKVDANSQPMHLKAEGTGDGVTLQATTTPFVYFVDGTQYTILADVTEGNLQESAGTTTTLSANATKDTSVILTNASTFTVGVWGAFKNNTSGEIFLAYVESSTKLTNAKRGLFFDSSSANIPPAAMTSGQTIALLRSNYIFANTSGGINFCSTNVSYAASEPAGPAPGDYWFDQLNNTWKTYNGAAWVSANAVLIGLAVLDTTNCIGTFSYYPYKVGYSAEDSLTFGDLVSGEFTSNRDGYAVNVYGVRLASDRDKLTWSDADTGTTLSVSDTTYYLYLSPTGTRKISDIAPIDYQETLRGFYHPAKPWRAVGAYHYLTGSGVTPVSKMGTKYYAVSPSGSGNSATYVDLSGTAKVILRGGELRFSLILNGIPSITTNAGLASYSVAYQILMDDVTTVAEGGWGDTLAGASSHTITLPPFVRILSSLDTYDSGLHSFKVQIKSNGGAAGGTWSFPAGYLLIEQL